MSFSSLQSVLALALALALAPFRLRPPRGAAGGGEPHRRIW